MHNKTGYTANIYLCNTMNNSQAYVSRWLILGVIMLIIQVLLGGITRLTGSGLSITEWKPLLGALPPMNEQSWQSLFELYQQKTGQYKYLNSDFSLADFKFIYFWEWFHRNWARLISIVFVVPFIYFLYKRWITRKMILPLLGLFVLGAAQGLIGWIMVASGLRDDALYVNHIKLAAHFVSAMVLICFTYAFALRLSGQQQHKQHARNNNRLAWIIITTLGIQLVYGAFMAGLKAATVAPTWPDINGDYIPVQLFHESWMNHPINIHFIHRGLAYLIVIFVVIWYFHTKRIHSHPYLQRFSWIPLALISLQVLLGIYTVLQSTHLTRNGFGVFEYLAQLHQLVAMFVVLSFIWVIFITGKRNQRSQ